MYNNPVIPAGFVAANTDEVKWNDTVHGLQWNDGLVIQDTSGNQFVWVPVKDGVAPNGSYPVGDNTTVQYKKWTTTFYAWNNSYIINDSIGSIGAGTSVTTTPQEMYQINTYGGFYIARYEAGNQGGTLVSKPNVNVWNNITYIDSKSRSEGMYTSGAVRSGLVTGTQWDTVMKWLQNSGKSVTDSRNWGNHSDSISPANNGNGSIKQTGYSEHWKANNIYDIAGNTFSWTNEMFSTACVFRGGGYHYSGSTYPAAVRDYRSNNVEYAFTSFRPVLYIL